MLLATADLQFKAHGSQIFGSRLCDNLSSGKPSGEIDFRQGGRRDESIRDVRATIDDGKGVVVEVSSDQILLQRSNVRNLFGRLENRGASGCNCPC